MNRKEDKPAPPACIPSIISTVSVTVGNPAVTYVTSAAYSDQCQQNSQKKNFKNKSRPMPPLERLTLFSRFVCANLALSPSILYEYEDQEKRNPIVSLL